ncbi:hypothetical protein GII65_02165 [Escherichia coli]|nr:hypothetical protein [Escherichia coli]MFU71561.1 hypothetical protein [Escherichia coli]MRE45057.1 hypothetical protein [Escherichia coli]MRF13876.1 hypothetical protein [Escherichia coli]MRG22414.1 hypothetical protein [Escherichia coli]
METCFKILQLKFDKKLTNRCIGLTLHISASTVFEVLARFKASSLSWPLSGISCGPFPCCVRGACWSPSV